jgi:GntR family transcriptional regulator/MocR family aminotransferase
MSLERRVALVDFAQRVGAWIIEDDYDSEFRYEGQPLQSLSSLTQGASEHVIYIGTFSKMLFPAIRLGYMIVPMRLADTFAYARAMIDLQPSIVAQPTLTRFIADGHLAMHVRRMRIAYRDRRAVLLDALAEHAAGLLCAESQHAGMHLIASFTPHLRRRMDDKAAARLLAERGITAHPMSQFYAGKARSEGLLLGYACVDADAIRAGVVQMAAALHP